MGFALGVYDGFRGRIWVTGLAVFLIQTTSTSANQAIKTDSLLLNRASVSPTCHCAKAALPVPRDLPEPTVSALLSGNALLGGVRVQGQPTAWYEGKRGVRRMILRWISNPLPESLTGPVQASQATASNAGWSWAYELVEGNTVDPPWMAGMRNIPLEQTSYEMYQLNLSHGGRTFGLRMGLRWNDRIYWWQYIRADFIQRGPVFDLLRVGGPIYNEESTLQADVFLVLFANGVVEAYAHFINNQREGEGIEAHGIPVLALRSPEPKSLHETLDGSRARFDLGGLTLDLGDSAGYATPEKPGSIRTEENLVIVQPWMDQEVFGELLAHSEGIPEHRIIRGKGEGGKLSNQYRGEADKFWVAKAGDQAFPRGMARTVRFHLGLGESEPTVARYQAPGWWWTESGALPTKGFLPTDWWAVRRAVELGEDFSDPHPRTVPFELGRSSHDNDGTLGAALLMLGHLIGSPTMAADAVLPAYWWADIAVDHVDFTVHELPKYSWQWIVQPYLRWMGLVPVYWETGDPYLLETSKFASDAFYRFFFTNRPHRFVGRDCLSCADMLALYETTGEDQYLIRVREILAEARRSYGQTEWYWPGHQSGAGPNGVARQPSFDYVPMVIARLHVQMIEAADGSLPIEEETEAWEFIQFLVRHVQEKRNPEGWAARMTELSAFVLTALADRFPEEEEHWIGVLREFMADTRFPEEYDGGKAFSWINTVIRLDAWAWGARWEDGELKIRPRRSLIDDPRAPKHARVWTPEGWKRVGLE